MSFLKVAATKASALIGAAVSGLGVALAFASHYSAFVLPFLSPKGQAAVAAAITAAGTVQATLGGSVLSAVNAVADAAPSADKKVVQ